MDDTAAARADEDDGEPHVTERAPARFPWTNLVLFLLTIVSMFYVGATMVEGSHSMLRGWTFAVPLMAILLTHELGHYLQARRHGVEASLPFFLPMPYGPLGTFGAVIAMRGRIRTRNALFDIGASGPLAGMVVAVPVLMIGLSLSKVEPIPVHGFDEGQSLLYLAIKRVVLGPIPHGSDVFLHPTAFAGWAGLFMTMLNMLPVGQLDGGHVAYALFGEKQNRYSRWAHRSLFVIYAAVFAFRLRVRTHGEHQAWSTALTGAASDGALWLFWFFVLMALTWGERSKHPPTDDGDLSPGRRALAVFTLGLLPLLFMPTVLTEH